MRAPPECNLFFAAHLGCAARLATLSLVRSFLAKRWFLLLLVGGVALAALRPELLLPATRPVRPRVVVTLALFLIAWGLDSRCLGGALRRPLPAVGAVAVSYVAVPLLGLLAGPLMPSEDLRVGLLITACVPCTLASAVLWTRLAHGNEATALLVTLLTTSSSWLITPPWLVLGTGVQVDVHLGELMRELLLFLVLPVALAQLSRALPPVARLVTRWRSPLGLLSQLLVLSVILRASVDARLRLDEHSAVVSAAALLIALAVCLGVHLAALAGGFWGGGLLRLDRAERIAVAFAGSQKTLPVALLLFEGYFQQRYPLAIVPLLFYHVGQLIVDTFIADALLHRRPHLPELPPEAEV